MWLVKTQTFTTATPDITAVFSADYEHYLAVLRCTSSLTGQYTAVQLINGTTAKATNYSRAGLVSTTGGVLAADSAATGQTEWRISGQSTAGIYATMTFYRPFVNAETSFKTEGVYNGNYYASGGIQTESYIATGFKILASGNAATYTGTISVYGYKA
jgi:hypothetical protein